MLLNNNDLAYMRVTQQSAMHDTGRVLLYTVGALNEYGEADAATYTAQDPIICGVEMKSGSERANANMTVINYDAVIRVPLSIYVTERDRFEVLSRYAEYPENVIYDIVSPPQRGASAIRLLLRKVIT